MPGRHQIAPVKRSRLRWSAGVAGALVAAAVAFAFFPATAGADTTVDAQLSLSGVATKANVLGGSEIGIHPGDTVNFKPSPVPTAGLENVPALGSVLNNALGGLLGKQYQVVVSFGSSFPGGAQTVTLGGPATGKCAGVPAKRVRFPAKGTYNFTWTVKYVLPGLLGCKVDGISAADLNLLGKAGVALNASNSWIGKIVVADNPPQGGISIQLPGVSVAPSVAGHQLPTVGVPGVNLPTIPVTIPSLSVPSLPGGGSNGGGTTTTPGGGSTGTSDPGKLPVPARVVPSGDGDAVFGNIGGGTFPGILPAASGLSGGSSNLLPVSSSSAANGADVAQNSTGKHKTIDLASNKAESTGQFSVILAIVAIVALSVVAATYARLYLLRRETT
jgi:hypothetical protein